MNESKFNAYAHKFKYRSPLWIESDSDISKSSSSGCGGLGNSDDSIECCSSNSSGSINNFLDSKVLLTIIIVYHHINVELHLTLTRDVPLINQPFICTGNAYYQLRSYIRILMIPAHIPRLQRMTTLGNYITLTIVQKPNRIFHAMRYYYFVSIGHEMRWHLSHIHRK